MHSIKKSLHSIYTSLNARTGGALAILTQAFQHFSDKKASESAASIAFYAFFSIFPLLLVIVSVLTSLLERQVETQELLNSLERILPVSQQVFVANIETVIKNRGTFNLIAVIGFIWSASGVFRTLVTNINRAWPQASRHSTLRIRILALAMVVIVIAFVLLSLIASAGLDLLFSNPSAFGDIFSSFLGQRLLRTLSRLIPFLIKVFIFWGLYRWVPTTDIRRQAAWWSAVVVALAWELSTAAFTWYINSGLANYEIVYGSLAAIVALLLWFYLISWLLLFGAYLTAAIGNSDKNIAPI